MCVEYLYLSQRYIPGVALSEERGRELHYLLPLAQSRPPVMIELFTQLDLSREQLGIESYGLTACNMEEVCQYVCGGVVLEEAAKSMVVSVMTTLCVPLVQIWHTYSTTQLTAVI